MPDTYYTDGTLRISTFIKLLQKIQEEHGDVFVESNVDGDLYIDISRGEDGAVEAIIIN